MGSPDHASNGDIESQIRSVFGPLEHCQVLLCDMLKHAYVVVAQTETASARSLASRTEWHRSWRVHVLTEKDLTNLIRTAIAKFEDLAGMDETTAQALIEQGYMSYRELSRMNIHLLAEMFGDDEVRADHVLREATRRAERETDS